MQDYNGYNLQVLPDTNIFTLELYFQALEGLHHMLSVRVPMKSKNM